VRGAWLWAAELAEAGEVDFTGAVRTGAPVVFCCVEPVAGAGVLCSTGRGGDACEAVALERLDSPLGAVPWRAAGRSGVEAASSAGGCLECEVLP